VDVLAQALVPTIVLGFIYAAVATGFVVLFKSVGILSFAQGAFMVFGALLFYSLVTSAGLPLIAALVATLVAVGLAGALSFKIVYNRAMGADPLILSFSTVGLAIVVETVLYLIWGTQSRNYPTLVNFGTWHATSNIVIGPGQVLSVAVCLVVVVAIVVLIRYTRVGIRMRATADGQTLASYYGIRVDRIAMLAWGLAAVCAAAGGVVFSISTSLDPVNLPDVGLATFPAIILGGVDSLAGAVAGGLLVALVGTVLATAFGGQYQDFAAYTLLLVVLLIRPRGLFGSPDVTRL
jgi:branched-chain amino acid transport system permease protein